jgi:tetratricopeptide (TPR) repeat protein
LEAYLARGNSLFFFGEFAAALENLERAVALYDSQKHRVHAFVYGLEPGVFCLQRMASALWIFGYPDQASRKAEDAVALARQQSHPLSLAIALNTASWVHNARGEWLAAQQQAEAAIALCAERADLPAFWRREPSFEKRRWQSRDEARRQLRCGRSGKVARATGMRLFETNVLRMRADACLTAERSEEGLAAVDRAIAIMGTTGERFVEAELRRLQGQLFLMQDASNTSRADRSFRDAIELARRQRAKTFELRATTSVARLLQKGGKKADARQILAEIYGWFTEGFATSDLREANALLEELS